ncbi:serine/threonine protein kinase [Myxococcota bacterium]|nr:serine/threonine protein kinase [Myxococcota bacterium]
MSEQKNCHEVDCPVRGQGLAAAKFCPKCGRSLQASEQGAEDPLIGEVIGQRYRILRVIGRGGMGVVYKVEHIVMGKIMAMKLLHGHINNRQNAIKRFRQEIKIVSRLSHVNTISVFDCGVTADGNLFIVMEYLRGTDLERLLEHQQYLGCIRAARIARQICASLAEAHEIGIIHRDIKPANVILLRDRGAEDFVKVLDFGIAKLLEPGQNMVTEVGLIVGTPYYMSPEQAMGRMDLGPAVDIYSLGVVLYEMVAGRLPFLGENTADYIHAHLNIEPPRPSTVSMFQDIDRELDELIMQALQKDQRRRFASIEAMQYALDRYIHGTLSRGRQDSFAVSGVLAMSQIAPLVILEEHSSSGEVEAAGAQERTELQSAESIERMQRTKAADVRGGSSSDGASSKVGVGTTQPKAALNAADGRGVSGGKPKAALDTADGQGVSGGKPKAALDAADGRGISDVEPKAALDAADGYGVLGAAEGDLQSAARPTQDLKAAAGKKSSQASLVPEVPSLPAALISEPPEEQLATRADWERVERGWRRSYWWQTWGVVWLLLLVAVVGGGWWGWERWTEVPVPRAAFYDEEQENNNTMEKATPIRLGAWVKGELGRRLSETSSDRDWFTFEIPEGKAQSVAIRLQPPAALDVELGLYRQRIRQEEGKRVREPEELISINNARRGGEERLLGYRLEAGRYEVLVRELVVMGEPPQEYKGAYRLRVDRVVLDKHAEIEPNDQFALANRAPEKELARGYHDRAGDIDFWYFETKKKQEQRYRLRFFGVAGVTVDFALLDEGGQSLRFWARNKRIRRKGTTAMSLRTDLFFSAKGRVFVRILAKEGHNLEIPYAMRLMAR